MLLQAGEMAERLDSLRAVKVGLVLVATDFVALALVAYFLWLGGRDSNPDSQIQSLTQLVLTRFPQFLPVPFR